MILKWGIILTKQKNTTVRVRPDNISLFFLTIHTNAGTKVKKNMKQLTPNRHLNTRIRSCARKSGLWIRIRIDLMRIRIQHFF
jgi:hypothetical protein